MDRQELLGRKSIFALDGSKRMAMRRREHSQKKAVAPIAAVQTPP